MKAASALLLMGLFAWSAAAQEKRECHGVKPIRGTWINLFYQDGRNLYTNPGNADMTSSELWRTKIREFSEMGVEYLVFLAVANDGKAMYESDFMPRAYPEGRESPIEAIMRAADQYGMKVFMSNGWAKNQDDRMSDPGIQDRHLRIMRECAAKFGKHPSFHGWYFPVEFSVAPGISEKSVQDVNALASEARKLTPKARLMISPYRPTGAIVDEKYVARLANLDVDIIAYQDGVGCVFASEPAVREAFARLRWAHNRVPKIALWGNVETFTWEKKPNNRASALVPAAFPRVLSQLAGISPYVDENITWIVQGMFEKPGTPVPAGQPVWSEKLARDYTDFLAGKGRWPLLAASFAGDLTHDAIGEPVTLSAPAAPKYNTGGLTDGRLGVEDYNSPSWLGFEKTDLDVTVDLGKSMPLEKLAARFLQFKKVGIRLPSRVDFSVSEDGKNFRQVASVQPVTWGNDDYDCWIDMAVAGDLKARSRYVRVKALNAGQWLFVDEVLINPRVKK